MKSKTYRSMRSRIGWITVAIVILVVLSGCGKEATSTDATATILPNDQVPSHAPMNPVMNSKELELSMMFRSFIQMDNQGETLLTKEQAESMLPIVSKITEDGELSADNKLKLLAILTPEQKKFVNALDAQFKQFSDNFNKEGAEGIAPSGNPVGSGDGKRPEMTDEKRKEFEKNMTDEEKKKFQDNIDSGKGNQGPGGQGNSGFGGFGNSGENIEQQLLDLLDSKINN